MQVEPSLAVKQMLEIAKNNTMSKKEIMRQHRADHKKCRSPEYVDRYIYAIEHEFVRDGIVDWSGCRIDESWERYKESVGYYKRHPEREAESRAFTKEIMNWWKEYQSERNRT